MRAGSKETICALAQLSTQRSLLGAAREAGDPWRGADPAHHVHLKKSPIHRFGGKMLRAEAGGIKDRQILRRPR
jgi:hypothetical protein